MLICPFTVPFFTRKNQREDDKLARELKQIEDKIKNIPRTFRYYCSHCGYQTNKHSKLCPKCRKGRFVETELAKDAQKATQDGLDRRQNSEEKTH